MLSVLERDPAMVHLYNVYVLSYVVGRRAVVYVELVRGKVSEQYDKE